MEITCMTTDAATKVMAILAAAGLHPKQDLKDLPRIRIRIRAATGLYVRAPADGCPSGSRYASFLMLPPTV